MIKARHTWWFEALFYRYLNFILWRSFRSICIDGGIVPSKSAIVVANHSSWWDGFWVWHLVHRRWGKRMFTMMQREQLEKHRFFSRLGCFSIVGKGRELLESISYASQLLEDNRNVVLIFPQGRIESSHQDAISFRGGVSHLVKLAPAAQVIGVVMLTDYGSFKKPTLNIYLENLAGNDIEMEYQQFYSKSLEKQRSKWCM